MAQKAFVVDLTSRMMKHVDIVRGAVFDNEGRVKLELIERESPCPFLDAVPQRIRTSEYLSKQVLDSCSITNDLRQLDRGLSLGGVTIIDAPTGCGKSLAIMQIYCYARYRKHLKALFVVPTRALARELALRSNEIGYLKWAYLTGNREGDQDSSSSWNERAQAHVLVVTPTIAQRLLSDGRARNLDVVVMDECHARTVDYSTLISTARSRGLRDIILMSATLVEKERFHSILKTGLEDNQIRILEVRPPMINSKEFFYYDLKLDERWKQTEYMKRIDEHMSQGIRLSREEEYEIWRDVQAMADPDYRDIYSPPNRLIQIARVESIVKSIIGEMVESKEIGKYSIIVFLDGMKSINEMKEKIEEMTKTIKCEIVLIHSQLNYSENIVAPPKANTLKIYLSTAAGQAGRTYPMAKYLVDACLSKNPMEKMPHNVFCLELVWSDGPTIDQRAGRSGRDCPGEVYFALTEAMVDQLKQTSHTTTVINRSFSSADLLTVLPALCDAVEIDELRWRRHTTLQEITVDPIDDNSFRKAVNEGLVLNLIQESNSEYEPEFILSPYGNCIALVCSQSGASPRQVRGILGGILTGCLRFITIAIAANEYGMRPSKNVKTVERQQERNDHALLVDMYCEAMKLFHLHSRPNCFDWTAVEAITDAIDRAEKAVAYLGFGASWDNRWNANARDPKMMKASLTIVFGDQLMESTDGGDSYNFIDRSNNSRITSPVLTQGGFTSERSLAVFGHINKDDYGAQTAILTEIPHEMVALFACTAHTKIIKLPMSREHSSANDADAVNNAVQIKTSTGLIEIHAGESLWEERSKMNCHRAKDERKEWAERTKSARDRIEGAMERILVQGTLFTGDPYSKAIFEFVKQVVSHM